MTESKKATDEQIALLRKMVADFQSFADAGPVNLALTAVLDELERHRAMPPLNVVRVFWQQHTLSDALSMSMPALHNDVELMLRRAIAAPQTEGKDR